MIPTVDGVTVQFAPVVPAQVPPVQTNDVAVGLHVVVRLELLPRTMVAGKAVRVQVGAGGVTVNTDAATPPPVVTTTFPAPTIAETGTNVEICVALMVMMVAAAPPMVTDAPVKLVPVMVTTVPATPDNGDTNVIVGGGGMPKPVTLIVSVV